VLEQVFRDEWSRVLASLVGFLADFDKAEDAAQEAFAIAAERWPASGVPSNPGAWLVTTARNRAIDRIRREHTLVVSAGGVIGTMHHPEGDGCREPGRDVRDISVGPPPAELGSRAYVATAVRDDTSRESGVESLVKAGSGSVLPVNPWTGEPVAPVGRPPRRPPPDLGVPGHKVGDSRLVGGRPPSAVCRRRVL